MPPRNEALVFREFEQRWRTYATKGLGAYVGVEWARSPAWGTAPHSTAYKALRTRWHQNLGELVSCHLRLSVGSNGPARRRLHLSLTHADLTRLVAIERVAGGRVKQNPHHTRLFTFEAADDIAFGLLKAGRLYADPGDGLLFDRIDAAVSFRRAVPGAGNGKTRATAEQMEKAQAAQIFWGEQLARLEAAVRDRPHDCRLLMLAAGRGGWPDHHARP